MAKVKSVLAKREGKGKQHELRSASLDRIAKAIRRSMVENYGPLASETRPMRLVAQALKDEAKYLRTILRCAVIGFVLCFAGCTDNMRAKEFGGTMTRNLPAGQKLVTATWKDSDLWLLYRPMRGEEQPEISTLHEESSIGVFSGTVIIRESR